MDYSRQPVSAIFKGPLISTPQGIACIFFSIIAVAMGVIHLMLPASISDSKVFSFGWSLFIWPILLFVVFIKHCGSSFTSSWYAVAMVSLYGVIPYALPFLSAWL